MNIGLFDIGCMLAFFLKLPAYGEEIITCIPKKGAPIQYCHTYSISCLPGSYIRFQALQYHWSDCLENFNCPGNGQCCNIRNINYYCHSEIDMMNTYRLFEICSGQRGCNGTALDVNSGVQEPTECTGRNVPDRAVMVPLSVSMEYDCVKAWSVINPCEEVTRFENDTDEGIHFMYKRGSQFPASKQPTLCTCSIQFDESPKPKQPPSLAYQDIRLHRQWNAVRDSACSSVHLSVSTSSKMEDRHCTSIDPVSSFYIRDPEPVDTDLVIKLDSLFNDGPQDEPEMIWLSLKASSPVTIVCGSQIVPQKQQQGVTIVCGSQIVVKKQQQGVTIVCGSQIVVKKQQQGVTIVCGSQIVVKKQQQGDVSDDDDDESAIVTIVIPTVCAVIALVCLITVFIVLRKRRTKSGHSLQSRSGRSTVRTVGDFDVYDTIDDLSRQNSKYSKTGDYTQEYVEAYSAAPVGQLPLRPTSDYSRVTSADDYNRINLRTHEITHDPDYSRLHSDADSGVGDTFGILHIHALEDNGNDIDDGSTESEDKHSVNTRNGHTGSDSLNKETGGYPTYSVVKRKDSYEKPEIKNELDNEQNVSKSVVFDYEPVNPVSVSSDGGAATKEEKLDSDC